jgi:hypothetical protein
MINMEEWEDRPCEECGIIIPGEEKKCPHCGRQNGRKRKNTNSPYDRWAKVDDMKDAQRTTETRKARMKKK